MRHHLNHEQTPRSARPTALVWLIGLGVVATTGLTIVTMVDALSGRDPLTFGWLAAIVGAAVCLVVAVGPAFAKQQPASGAVSAPASSRRTAFVSLSSMWLALYVLAISNVQWMFGVASWPFWAGIAAAVVATLSVGGLVYALLRYLARETDEYQRLLLMRAALIAAALTFVALTAWGLLELYVGAPQFRVAMAVAPFFLFFAITNWWMRGRT